MARGKLTPEQVEEIIDLREEGRGLETIARRFGVSRGAVFYQCLKHGAVSPAERAKPVPTEARTFNFGSRAVRCFTQAEDERLLELRIAGGKIHHIAQELGRGNTSIRIRLLQLAVREDMPA